MRIHADPDPQPCKECTVVPYIFLHSLHWKLADNWLTEGTEVIFLLPMISGVHCWPSSKYSLFRYNALQRKGNHYNNSCRYLLPWDTWRVILCGPCGAMMRMSGWCAGRSACPSDVRTSCGACCPNPTFSNTNSKTARSYGPFLFIKELKKC